MDAMGRLAVCAADAVGRNPKEGWQDSLIRACDDVEEKYDELLAALESLDTKTLTRPPALYSDIATPHYSFNEDDAQAIREAIAKAKGGE